MERDFMGLNLKEPLAVVKEEMNNDGCKNSGFKKGRIAQWPFSNKVSALPHLMSFKASQDDKTKNTVSDTLSSSGFMSILSQEAFDTSQKRSAGEPQSFNHDGQGDLHFSLTSYPVQHDVNHPHDVKMFSVPNQAISVSLGNPFLKNHFAAAGQKPLLGGIPVTTSHSVLPSAVAVAGMTESCNSVKPSAQLTIFYAGTVNIFDDISAEKVPISKLGAGAGVPVSQPANTSPGSGLSSPLSVSSHTGVQSGSGLTSTDEFLAAKTTGVPNTPICNVEPPKVVSATTMLTSAVPQARKASLARFLEKRKERVMSAAPYNLNKKSEECATAEYAGVNFSATNTVLAKQG
ncbi:protein TIFY 7 isoform X6 [Glycine max]|uniref:protein TIFY 7 isoform X6 n=1 Tax=Glycine max TaxID=3847 RepID=UPI001B3550C6|nr:protein TIFY 7 isoform X6 [Glycine max]